MLPELVSISGELVGLMKHEAAAVAVRYIDKPSKVGELVDVLQGNGYDDDKDRKTASNSLYTAMDRHNENVC